MKNYIYIATSVDGYIAKKDGDIDWLTETPNPTNNDYGFANFMDSMDALVMGRNTYEKVLTFGAWVYPKKVFVLTSKLTEVPSELVGKVEFIKGGLKIIVKKLNSDGYKNLYIDGGKTIQQFLRENLIDELIITRIPTILGGGIPLFDKLETPIKLEQIETTVYDNALVKTHYKVIK